MRRLVSFAVICVATGCGALPNLSPADEEILKSIREQVEEELVATTTADSLHVQDAIAHLTSAWSTAWVSDVPPNSDWRALHVWALPVGMDADGAAAVTSQGGLAEVISLGGHLTPQAVLERVKAKLNLVKEKLDLGVELLSLPGGDRLQIQAPQTQAGTRAKVHVALERLARVKLPAPDSTWRTIAAALTGADPCKEKRLSVGPFPVVQPATAQSVAEMLNGICEFTSHFRAEVLDGVLSIRSNEPNRSLDVIVTRAGEDTSAIARNLAEVKLRQEKYREFLGFNFGAGVGFSMDIEGPRRVDKAEVRGGVVRVEQERKALPRILLETHYFFVPNASFFCLRKPGTWGIGPFMGIQASADEAIDAFAAGVMMGFRRDDMSQSLNLAVGAVLDSSVKVLGRGLRDGMPLPPGETTARLREEDRWGVGVFFSIGF